MRHASWTAHRQRGNLRGARKTVLALASMAMLNRAAFASSGQWQSATSGLWTDASRWTSNPFFPNGINDAATIAALGSPYTVTLNSDISVASLLINSPNATLNHVAGTFTLNSGNITVNQGTYLLSGGTISGATIQAQNTGTFLLPAGSSGTLSGTTLLSNLLISNGYTLNARSGLTLSNRTLTLGSDASASILNFVGAQSLNGTGTIIFDGTTDNGLLKTSGLLTIGANSTLRSGLRGGQIGDAGSSINNLGTISAQTANRTLTINAGAFSNGGTIEAINGGTILLGGAFSNPPGGVLSGALFHVGANSNITLNSGSILTNNATIYLDGVGSTFAAVDGLTTNSGTFQLGNGRSFTSVAGFANNGTISVLSGSAFNLSTGTNDGTLIANVGGTINVNGSYTFSGTSTVLGGGALVFNAVQNFNGVLTGNIGLSLAGTTTFGSTATVSPTSLNISNFSNSAAPGARLNVGSGGLNLIGATSPAISLGAGANPAILTLNGNVSVSGNSAGLAQILTSGSGALDGTVDLGNNVRTFTIAAGPTAPDMLITARIINGAIIKSGPGTLALTHSNSYTAGTSLANGTLQITDADALGTGSVQFQGGTLSIRSDAATTNLPNAFTAAPGTGSRFYIDRVTPGSAGIFSIGAATLGNSLRVDGTGTLSLATVTLGSSIIIDGTAAVSIASPLSGAFNVSFGSGGSNGAFALTGAGSNSYSGTTTANGGLLMLNKAGNSIPANLQILGGTTQLLASNQIADSGSVTVSNGTLEMVGTTDSIGSLNLSTNGMLIGFGTLSCAQGFALTTSSSSVTARNGTLRVLGTTPSASGGTLLSGNWIANNGTLSLPTVGGIHVNQATITLIGSGTFTNLASLENNNGTILLQNAKTLSITQPLSNNGGVIRTDSTSSLQLAAPLVLNGGTVSGNISAAPGGLLVPTANGALDGVTLNTDLGMGSNSRIDIYNDLKLNGNVTMSPFAGQALLYLHNNSSILGPGHQIVLGGDGGAALVIPEFTSGSYTIGPGVTVRGGASLGNSFESATSIINQGTIQADVSEGSIDLAASTFSNSGTVAVTNNSTLRLQNNWSNSGTLLVNNGTLLLSGTFTTASLANINRNDGMIRLAGTMNNAQQTFAINAQRGSILLDGGTILGGTVSTSDGAALIPTANGNLNGVTLNTDLAMGSNSRIDVYNGLALGGNVSMSPFSGQALLYLHSGQITGPGHEIVLGGNGAGAVVIPEFTAGTISFGSGLTVRGETSLGNSFESTTAVVNQGTIRADVGEGSIDIAVSTFSNSGTVGAINGSMLRIVSNWSNTGTLLIDNGTLMLGGTFTTASLGTINRTGGTLELIGAMDNSAQTLTLNAQTGSLRLNGGTITGGTISTSGAASLIVTSNGNLSGVTYSGDLLMGSNSRIDVYNGLTLSGNLVMTPAFGQALLYLHNNSSILGPGHEIVLGGDGAAALVIPEFSTGTITIGPGLTVRGYAAIGNSFESSTALVNQGTIRAEFGEGSINVAVSTFSNSGTVGAINGSTLRIDSNWSNSGTLLINNSTLTLGGTFSTPSLGIINRSGGTMELVGSLKNTGQTLSLDGQRGSLILNGGTITGGTISTSSGSRLIPTANGALDGVTLSTDLVMGSNSRIDVFNNLMLNGTMTMSPVSGQALLYLHNNSSILGPGHDLVLGGNGNAALVIPEFSNGTITIGPGVTVRGQASLGNSFESATMLANLGTLRATQTSGSLSVSVSTFTSSGTIGSAGNSVLYISAPFTNSNGGTIDVNGGVILDYAGATPAAIIRNQLKSGFANGAWNGPGINSSDAKAIAANPANPHKTAVGYVDTSTSGIGFSILSQGMDASSIGLMYTFTGDANLDGRVNSIDFTILAQNFNTSLKVWVQGDFNYDGSVNALDFNAVAGNYGSFMFLIPSGPSAGNTGGFGSLVPEPSMAMMLFSLTSIRRRRKR